MTLVTLPASLIEEVIAELNRRAYDTSYGVSVIVDDPHDFSPDPECCTPEEIEAHRLACEAADRGEPVEIPRHYWREFASQEEVAAFMRETPGIGAVTFTGPGKLSHVNVQTWGMGTSTIKDHALIALIERLIEACGEAERLERRAGRRPR